MKKSTFALAGILVSASLAGCSTTSQVSGKPDPSASNVQVSTPVGTKAAVVYRKPERVKITGIGYGAESTFSAYTPGQRRLMAIRASKLDAYRALAEQLYGIKIDSNTSISTLTAKNDSFRARVNAVVRGARVVSVTPMADNNYETVLEVYVDKRFFEDTFIYRSDSAADVKTPSEVCVTCYEAGAY
ncbi:LPP20 family lipoprotein [Thiomicrorhabdus sp. ZW0627]|uniref:LPP20 family lipoprotein n=1 Tax=Thiomicrorhabdus sp. ZW0627 TaxID=3039774 RepID=UPI00243691C6|nr:LPP20 family lipoprotein [Thiomicrorhabdus sp. ZW0627]MDG6773386.1 LPP20 family lipoprotein [Thiomicrorhabdus sp. ZW0627]